MLILNCKSLQYHLTVCPFLFFSCVHMTIGSKFLFPRCPDINCHTTKCLTTKTEFRIFYILDKCALVPGLKDCCYKLSGELS